MCLKCFLPLAERCTRECRLRGAVLGTVRIANASVASLAEPPVTESRQSSYLASSSTSRPQTAERATPKAR